MPCRELRTALLLGALSVAAAAGVDPHLDPTLLPNGCASCHPGHGVSRSPMLRGPAVEGCLACHDSRERADAEVRRGNLAAEAQPPLLGTTLSRPWAHPLDRRATSRHEPNALTCTSCHSPHRRSTRETAAFGDGLPRPSPRDPRELEYQLCQRCHGRDGPESISALDLGRLFDPSSRSAHPVHAPALERSPSVVAELAGKRISCTECHDSDDRRGPRGPHASAVAGLLGRAYTTVDGSEEGEKVYALCYACHDRERVLDGDRFPLHRLHVERERASCATCHSPHGSLANRALIRFGEEPALAAVAASSSTGRLEFVSDGPGSGSCYLSCHGVDHGPMGYGGFVPEPGGSMLPGLGLGPGPRPFGGGVESPRERGGERQQPPP